MQPLLTLIRLVSMTHFNSNLLLIATDYRYHIKAVKFVEPIINSLRGRYTYIYTHVADKSNFKKPVV